MNPSNQNGNTKPNSRADAPAVLICREGDFSRLAAQLPGPCDADYDPFSGLRRILSAPLRYRQLVLSLDALFPEELSIIRSVKQRLPHIRVVVADVEGRGASLASAVRLGADAILVADGIHAIADEPAPAPAPVVAVPDDEPEQPEHAAAQEDEDADSDPVLTPEELRALLGP